jgi:hypothetical protein
VDISPGWRPRLAHRALGGRLRTLDFLGSSAKAEHRSRGRRGGPELAWCRYPSGSPRRQVRTNPGTSPPSIVPRLSDPGGRAVRRALLWRTVRSRGHLHLRLEGLVELAPVAALSSWFRWAAAGVRLSFEHPPLRAKCTDPVTVLACNSCARSTSADPGRTERRTTEIRARVCIGSGPTVHHGERSRALRRDACKWDVESERW